MFKHKHVHRKKKMPLKLDQCCAVFIQPLVVYCKICKAVDRTHFARNLISGLAFWD